MRISTRMSEKCDPGTIANPAASPANCGSCDILKVKPAEDAHRSLHVVIIMQGGKNSIFHGFQQCETIPEEDQQNQKYSPI